MNSCHVLLCFAGIAVVCEECVGALRHGHVPKAAFARFDAGTAPDLPPLTLLEMLLVATYRAIRAMYMCKPGDGRGRPYDTLHRCHTGHVIALCNPKPSDIIAVFPAALEDVPEIIQVVYLTAAANEEELQQMAANTPALQVSALCVVRVLSV